ncbi:TetR/AcrR family transcriptional regulator [Amycolatopsis pithecellobii]|uniref:TetR family transcriptional regulator n=1 Tax=Amycolatopsis pithecellobii TaxID=664692 RepID=A0A6N7Z032_9PSEU|nr:TetR/AcrR family transcriptional regulator [Amycolatopsis pithecellobii]MTD57618.1 TetR family transcriptional regulator [Amycolatopsis pithecellobii]
MTRPAVSHQRNKPGEGSRLRGRIIAAAFEILDEEATVDAVTLRAVARRMGVTAPALYGHFRDLNDLRGELQRTAFADLHAACDEAAGGMEDPVRALLARCQTIATWGIEHLGRYRLMFTKIDGVPNVAGQASVDRLVAAVEECVSARRCDSDDPQTDTAHLLAALNGLVLTRTVMDGFPWPALTRAVHDIATRILRLAP